MAAHCPYLGLGGDRRQTHAAASPRHRCFAWGEAERIGAQHQSMTCLTTAFRRCPRLVTGAQVQEQPLSGSRGLLQASDQSPLPGDDSALRPVSFPPVAPGRAYAKPVELAIQVRPETPYTELRTARRPRAIECAVLGLAAAIVLAMAFTGYAVVYRLRVGPGLSDPPPVARVRVSSEVEQPATLVPTYTPTAVPGPTLSPPTLLPEPALAVAVPPARPAADSSPTRLVIAKIGLDIPVLPVGVRTVVENGKSRALWADVPSAGGFHETSALPGHLGNTVINGHRDIQGSVFRHLDQVAVGDEIVLYVGDVAYPYRVTETLVVPETFASAKQRAQNLRLIGPMPEERLTLVTCTPVGLATHRLLVVARPPEQASPDMPAAGSGPAP